MSDLQQALAQLKDVRLPEPVSVWQLAPGWWLSALFLILLTVLLYRVGKHYLSKNRYRRLAIKHFYHIQDKYTKDPNDYQLLSGLNQLIKSVAIQAYPSRSCAELSGSHWQQFLAETLNPQKAPSTECFILFDKIYREDCQLSAEQRNTLLSTSLMWLKKHVPQSELQARGK